MKRYTLEAYDLARAVDLRSRNPQSLIDREYIFATMELFLSEYGVHPSAVELLKDWTQGEVRVLSQDVVKTKRDTVYK